MTSRQAPSCQPLQYTAAAAVAASVPKASSFVAVKACRFSYLLISLLYVAAGAAACEGEAVAGNWCAAVPAVVNVDVQNHGEFVPAVQAVCPEHATVACGDIRHSDWCCPSGHTCGFTAANAVGCCPQGTTCGNNHEPVPQAITTTAAIAVAGAPIVVADDGQYNEHHHEPDPAAILVASETIVAAIPTTLQTIAALVTDTVFTPLETIVPAAVAEVGEFCSTIIAEGPGLPTTIPGVCGTVLVTSDGPWSVMKSGGYWVRDWHVWVGGAVWIALGVLL